MKKALSLLIALLTAFSVCVSASAGYNTTSSGYLVDSEALKMNQEPMLTTSAGISEENYNFLYSYMKNFVIANGLTTDNTYFLSDTLSGDGYYYIHFSTLTYEVNTGKICFTYSGHEKTYPNNIVVYIRMDIPATYTERYNISTIYDAGNYGLIGGEANLNPQIYTLDYYLYFLNKDRYGNLVSDTSLTNTLNYAFEIAVPQWNDIANKMGFNLGNLGFTKMYTPNQSIYPTYYSIVFDSNGHGNTISRQRVAEGNRISVPSNPTASGYTFGGWYKEPECKTKWNFNNPIYSDVTLYAKWTKIDNPTYLAVLNVGNSKSVDYRTKVKVYATAKNVPAGYYVAIYDGNAQLAVGNNTSVIYNAGEMTYSKTFTAKIVDANGNVQKDNTGANLQKDIKVTVNTGFFAKLIAFFKGLFGSLPTVEIKP